MIDSTVGVAGRDHSPGSSCCSRRYSHSFGSTGHATKIRDNLSIVISGNATMGCVARIAKHLEGILESSWG